jgi:hypothetical protein
MPQRVQYIELVLIFLWLCFEPLKKSQERSRIMLSILKKFPMLAKVLLYLGGNDF